MIVASVFIKCAVAVFLLIVGEVAMFLYLNHKHNQEIESFYQNKPNVT